jgi:hypothetical protein
MVERHAQHRQLVRVVAVGATTPDTGSFSTFTKAHLVNGVGAGYITGVTGCTIRTGAAGNTCNTVVIPGGHVREPHLRGARRPKHLRMGTNGY